MLTRSFSHQCPSGGPVQQPVESAHSFHFHSLCSKDLDLFSGPRILHLARIDTPSIPAIHFLGILCLLLLVGCQGQSPARKKAAGDQIDWSERIRRTRDLAKGKWPMGENGHKYLQRAVGNKKTGHRDFVVPKRERHRHTLFRANHHPMIWLPKL